MADYSTPYTSDHLYHFVGRKHPEDHDKNFNILCSILSSKCVSRNKDDTSWGSISYRFDPNGSLRDESFVMPNITCYAEIPKDGLGIHISKYGRFGIGIQKYWIAYFAGRPVTYIPMYSSDSTGIKGSTFLDDVQAITSGYRKHIYETLGPTAVERTTRREPESPNDANKQLYDLVAREFLAFLKPYDAELPENDPDNYYMEREWRKYGNLKFETDWVSNIFVAGGFKDAVEQKYPEYAGRVEELALVDDFSRDSF